MTIDKNKNCDDIELTDEGNTIIAYNLSGEKTIVPDSEFTWRNPYEDGDDYDLPLFLTLKEIREQLLLKGYKPVFYVCHEMGLSGTIYQYGNYGGEADYWIEHGKTKGYA